LLKIYNQRRLAQTNAVEKRGGCSSRRRRSKRGSLESRSRLEPSVIVFEQFLWGFLGSLTVEIVKIHGYLSASGNLPLRYRRPMFWVARLLLATTAGGLAVAYDIKTPVLALHVGAATPLIVRALAKNFGNLLSDS
jgi:hypothetical protein